MRSLRSAVLDWSRAGWKALWRRGHTDRQFLRSDLTAAPYSLLSTSPPIFYVKHWLDEQWRLQSCMDPIFEALRDRRAYFLYSWRWWIEDPARIAVWRTLEDRHRRRYRKHRFVHLCNSSRQWELFREAGLDAVFSNQNCLVDERIFRPLPGVDKRFDAVYDARLKDYKRHELAAEVAKLAILYPYDPEIDDAAYVQATRDRLAGAHFFNHETSATYRPLQPEEVNERLNLCRVGLCLSRREGAMYSSIQYLLSGLPVVTTASEGGRDVFFDDHVAQVVDDEPRAVRDAVAHWCRQPIRPDRIRAATLEKMADHRRRFVDTVQAIFDAEGIRRDFASQWHDVFFDKLFRERQRHEETLRALSP